MRPNLLQVSGNNVFLQNKGLYFINPQGKDPDKPTQIWTQGETEYSSVWFPTIDHPNQKTTEEIAITVPDSCVTLSNGLMTAQKKNNDATRTDTWKMEQRHSPYLFMIAVGNFTITRDHWENIPVDYYLEPAYAPYAKQIFGNTPEMIGFFSRILGIGYPWPKYDQIVVRDYVSGAMENTTATLHGEFLQQTPRETLDRNMDDIICHELFHQWFGDYVTTESWSNITLNESMADYSEFLWYDYKYGKDKSGELDYNSRMEYFDLPPEMDHNLVNFYYDSPEDVFDYVSYPKGGRILNMLRNYVGDTAFFASLHEYLQKYAYGSAEAQQLRLVFEDVTGKDLSWFWDQWYYGMGYPVLDISYLYDDNNRQVSVILKQTQENKRIFRLPMAVDVYSGNTKRRIPYLMDAQTDTLVIPFTNGKRPDLIDVDGDKVLLARVTDHKTLDNYIYQYYHAGTYLDRRQAIVEASMHQDDKKAVDFLIKTLSDPYEGLRQLTIDSLDLGNKELKKAAIPVLEKMAAHDEKSNVRAAALQKLAKLKQKKYEDIFVQALADSSYLVDATGLQGLYELDDKKGLDSARTFLKDNKGALTVELAKIFSRDGGAEFADFYKPLFANPYLGRAVRRYYIDYLAKTDDSQIVNDALQSILVKLSADVYPSVVNYFTANLVQVKEAKKDKPELSASVQHTIDSLNKLLEKKD